MVRKRTISEESVPMCGHRAHPKIKKDLTVCVRMPEHAGNHVYCMKVSGGIDNNSHSLHYHEEICRDILKSITIVEMAGRELSTTDDCAAIWQFFEWKKQ